MSRPACVGALVALAVISAIPSRASRLAPPQPGPDACIEPACAPSQAASLAWQNYAKFHADCKADPGCASKRALVWECDGDEHVCGGFGDQILGLASTLYLAMRLRRPFFVRWAKSGHDWLEVFTSNLIDAALPAGFSMDSCQSRVMLDYGFGAENYRAAMEHVASGGDRCFVWRTNLKASAAQLGPRDLAGIQDYHSPGCAFRFAFELPSLSPSDWQLLHGLEGRFAAIHFRVQDEVLLDTSQRAAAFPSPSLIGAALECAKSHNFTHVLFNCADEEAKAHAHRIASQKDMSLFVGPGKEIHVDKSRALSKEDIWRGMLVEWLAMTRAGMLVTSSYAGFGGNSGWSGTAASVALLAKDRVLNGECKAISKYWSFDWVQGVVPEP